jgi:predicted nucleic acid-binding protein
VSSVLFEAECIVTLRRYAARAPKRLPKPLLEQRTSFFREQLQSVSLRDVDSDILAVLHDEPSLAGCRTLDAVHLATALFFRAQTNESVTVVTFDERMRETAKKLQFDVLPGYRYFRATDRSPPRPP